MDNMIDADWERKPDELRQEIEIGVAQADQGLTRVFDKATLKRIKVQAKARLNKDKSNGRIRSSTRQLKLKSTENKLTPISED